MAIQVQGTTVIDDSRRLVNHRRTVSVISANTTANVGVYYVASSNLVLTLPSSPTVGDFIGFQNGNNDTKGCNVAGNGANIMYANTDLTVDALYATFTLTYANSTAGWLITF
jgi:hypothetical protein